MVTPNGSTSVPALASSPVAKLPVTLDTRGRVRTTREQRRLILAVGHETHFHQHGGYVRRLQHHEAGMAGRAFQQRHVPIQAAHQGGGDAEGVNLFPFNRYNLKARVVSNTTTVETVKAWIDEAVVKRIAREQGREVKPSFLPEADQLNIFRRTAQSLYPVLADK